MNILVIDIGGTHVKVLATGQKAHRQFDSGQDSLSRNGLGDTKVLS
jgi:polyphosphate glucokinase